MSCSSQTVSFCSDDSESDTTSINSDFALATDACYPSIALSDQTLLVQAFRDSVRGRKSAARDWLVERVEDISHAVEPEAPVKKVRSYSSKLRSLMRKLNISRE